MLRDVFRAHTLDARWREEKLLTALDVLNDAGITPILAKGWAVARHYPQKGLRPYGDLDLFVDAGQMARAQDALSSHPDDAHFVDLHAGPRGYAGSWTSIVDRAVDAELMGRLVRVFGAEDHLGLICSHVLFHGAWRPLWLVDVAVLVENIEPDFDWEYLNALPERQVRDVRVVVRLAYEVLRADIGRTPWSADPHRLPAWLPKATLDAWSSEHYSTTTNFALTEGGVGAFWRSARLRWPNPIEVTHRWKAPYNGFPRLPLQLLDSSVRAAKAVAGAPSLLSRRGAARGDRHESR